jgi:hypothetical protein
MMWPKHSTKSISNLIVAKAKRPRLNFKAKASIWLVFQHLRSLNTVNERLSMKNMCVERVILGCFEFTLFGMLKVQDPCGSRLLSFLTEGCSRQNFNYIL